MAKKKVTVVQDAEKPVERPVLADAIVKMSKAMQDLKASGLNRKAIILLVSHKAGQGQFVVRDVMDAMEQLRTEYTTK